MREIGRLEQALEWRKGAREGGEEEMEHTAE